MRRVAPYVALLAIALAIYIGRRTPASNTSDSASNTSDSATSKLDAESLRRSSFTWNAEELVYGFGYWEEVFGGREVPRGSRVHELPLGPPLADLAPGTPWAQETERYIEEQRVAGLIVVLDGSIRLERYGLGHDANGRWTSQSLAKSLTSTLVGAAVKDGFIQSIDEPVTTYVAGLRGSAYGSVTIRHLMTMTSGVRWNEDYTDPNSDIARFYSEPVEPGMNATVSYMRRLPGEAPPGSNWVYKTGETHLLGVLVTSATGQSLAEYLSAKVWRPYGMEQSASWSTDRTDHELAGCCFQASLRDYARFGQFVLDGGRVDGRSVVPDGWFEEATRTQVEFGSPGRGYGYQWWTYDDGSFNAIGIHGQLIHIDRARRLVIVLNSAWPVAMSGERSAAQSNLLRSIVAAVDAESGR